MYIMSIILDLGQLVSKIIKSIVWHAGQGVLLAHCVYCGSYYFAGMQAMVFWCIISSHLLAREPCRFLSISPQSDRVAECPTTPTLGLQGVLG